MSWDSTFKNVLKQLLSRYGAEVISEQDVPKANVRLDLMILNSQHAEFFSQFHPIIMGEFKSERDKLLAGDIFMLWSKCFSQIAVSYGYGNKKSNLDPIEMSSVTAMMFLGGKKSPHQVGSFDLQMLEEGVYEIQNGCGIQTILIALDYVKFPDELASLKLFGSYEVRNEEMARALHENDKYILSLAYFFFTRRIWKSCLKPKVFHCLMNH